MNSISKIALNNTVYDIEDKEARNSYKPNLLEFKWSDHILNDIQWLRADTFSWQDGGVYEAAYNHLVDDITNASSETTHLYAWDLQNMGHHTWGTIYTKTENTPIDDVTDIYDVNGNQVSWRGPEHYYDYDYIERNSTEDVDVLSTLHTETVAGYTITYYEASDGHKIVLPNMAQTVLDIYNATGVAWYFILDTANERFKLPRINPAKKELIQVVRAKGNGKSLGLSDGNYNAGLRLSGNNTSLGVYNNSYDISLPSTNSDGSLTFPAYSVIGLTSDSTKSGIISDMSESTSVYAGQKYLYFYVGDYTQTAIEQTAGLNAELFNSKLDLDLENITNSSKETIIGWGMPDYSTGVSRSWDTSYLADKDTVICYQTNHQSGNDNVEPKVSSDNSNWITLYGQNAGSSNLKVGGWFVCPKGWYWKVTGGRNVDRMLVSYIVKGEV